MFGIVTGDDVFVIQFCGGSNFVLETGNGDGVIDQMRFDDLDGDVTIHQTVARMKHVAHSTTADSRDDFIAAVFE